MGINKMVGAKANMHLKVNLNAKDAQAALASLAKKLENLEKISAIDLDVKNIKGIGDLLVQLQTLDQSMTALLGNSKIAGQSLRDEMVGSINSVIDAFQHGNELSNVFLNELNEIANITDKSQMPEKIRALVERMNQEFKGLGVAIKINADDILNLGSTKEQLNSLAGYVTKFTSTWSNGMTFAAQQTNGLVKSVSDVEAEINKLLTKLNELRTVEKSVAGIINTISSGGEFKRLSKEENETIDEFAEKALNRYNEAEQRFIANQSNLEARQKAAIDMANAAKDVIRAMSYDFTDEDGGVWEIADVVDEDVSSGLEEAKNRFLSRAKEIKSLFKTEIADIEQQLSAAGIDIKTPVHVTPQKDPKAGKKIKQAVEESAPKEVEVPVKTNLNTDNTKEIVSLVEQLQKVFDIGRKKNTLEYKILFTADGLDIRNGSFEGINSKTYAESLLSNLMSGVNVNAHSHMGKYSELTLPDIKSAIDAKKNLDINISAVIGPDDIATLDLAQVKLEDLYTLLEKLSKLPYTDAMGIRAQDLNNALKEINPNYGDIFKQWKPEKFEELAKYIYNVSQATQSTIDPLEQFKNIVSFIASKDIDFSKHQGILDSISANNFSQDALKSAFNEIAQAEKIMSDGKILQIDIPEKSALDAVTKSLQDQIDAYRTKRKEAGLTFEKLRQEILMLEANHYDTKGSFIERFFHPSELDDVIKTLKSGGSVKAITEKLASEFSIEIPVKTKVDQKNIDDSAQSAAQSLEKIEQQEKEIAEAARQREEAQRKANEEGSKTPKVSGTVAGSVGTGTGTDGTTPSPTVATGTSIDSEIADLERLKAKVSEVELEVVKKTRAFNDEKAAVSKVVEAEMSELTKLSTKIKQVIGEVNNYSTAWTNADSNVIAVIEKSINKLVELETKLTVTINNINGIGQGSGSDSGSYTLSLYDKILEKVKQAKVESEKIQHSPDLNKLFEGSLLWSSRQRDADQAIVSINTLIDKIKYLNQLDKSVSMQEYVSSGLEKYKDIQTQLFDIDTYTRGPDAPGARTWDKLISNIKEKFLGLARFLQNENIDIFSSLNSEQLQIIENFNFKSLLGELDSYSSMMYEVQTTNINARDSISDIVKEIIEIANAAGMAQDKVQGLKDYLYGFKHMFPTIGDADETTNKILDRAGLLYANTKEKHNKATVYSSITDSQLSSTLDTLNKTLSQFIGSNDPSSQSTDPNKGISGIADNVAQIYKLLSNPEKQSDKNEKQNTSDEDSSLSKTLSALNENIARMVGSNDPATQNTDPNNGLSGIADNVANIYGILNGRKDSDDQLATSIKSAVDELSDASKYIAEDAKLRKESNTKYQVASDRISTDAGRDTIVGSINRKYGDDYFIPDSANTKFSALSGGIVKVETTLQDLNNKFYDVAATIDSQGNVVTSSMKENGEATRKYAEQEKALAKAREDAYKKTHKTAGEFLAEKKQKELEAKRTISPEVLDGAVKSTTKTYNDYYSKNIGNTPQYLVDDYSALLQIIKQVKSENRNLDAEELRAIESMCVGLQNEIALLEVVNKNYDDKAQTLRESMSIDGNSLLGKEDSIQAQKYFNELENKVKKLNEKLDVSDISLINKEEIIADQKEIDDLITRTEKFIETAKKAKTVGGFDKTKSNQFDKAESAYKQSISGSTDLDLGEDGVASLNRYKQAYEALLEKKQYFQNISKNDVTETDIQEWDRLTKELAECRKEYENFAKEYSKGKVESISAEDAKDVGKLRENMIKLATDGEKGKKVTEKFSNANKKLTMTFQDANNELKEVIVTYNKATGTITKSIGDVNKTKNAWEKFTSSVGNKMREMGAYFATFVSFYEVIAVVRQGITYVKEIDSALTELKKVTDETDEAYAQFLQNMSKTAGVVGSTVKDLTTMAAEWSRLGYSMAESAKLAESTAILLNVSEFSDATEASEALISTMQAFQYTADESVHVVDILNEVGKLVAPR